MQRARRLILATTAAMAVTAAAPATGSAQITATACPAELDVNTCVNAAFDTALWAVDVAEEAWEDVYYKPRPDFCTLWRKLGGTCFEPPPPQ